MVRAYPVRGSVPGMAEGWDPVARRVRRDRAGTPRRARPDRTDARSGARSEVAAYVGGVLRPFVRHRRAGRAAHRRSGQSSAHRRSHRVGGLATARWRVLRRLGAATDSPGCRVVLAAGGDRCRSRPGVRVKRCAVHEDEVVIRYGVRCVTAETGAVRRDALGRVAGDRVIAMDMAAAAQLTSIRRMAAYAREPRRRVGSRSRPLGARARPPKRALSPQEVRLRLLWERLCGPTTLMCNPTVLDGAGRFVGMPDLLEARHRAGR